MVISVFAGRFARKGSLGVSGMFVAFFSAALSNTTVSKNKGIYAVIMKGSV